MLVDISFPGLGNTIVKVTRDRWFLHTNYINYILCHVSQDYFDEHLISWRDGTINVTNFDVQKTNVLVYLKQACGGEAFC